MSSLGMEDQIPLGAAYMSDKVVQAVAEVLQSGWPGPGPRAEAFEQAFARYCDGAFPVAVSSCTAALHLSLRLLELAPGTEVITTPITFVATNKVLLYEGLVPVFADVDVATGHICLDSMRAKISDKTGALLVMHYAGQPCDLDPIYALAAEFALPVIEDCAHAAGASYDGHRIGSHPGFQAFSFQSTKNVSAVDGGLLFVRSEKEMLRARRLRWMGIDSSTYERTGVGVLNNDYEVAEEGYRYAMSDLNAAIALVNLEELDAANARRAAVAARYSEAFVDLEGIDLLKALPRAQSSYHLFPVLSRNRDGLSAALRQRGIVTGRHYRRNDAYPVFTSAHLPGADYFSNHVLTLPMHPALTDTQVDRVIAAVCDHA